VRRIRRFSRSRRGTRRSDWVQALNECADSLEITRCVDGRVPADSHTDFTLVDSTDVLVHTDHLTVLRIVGDIGIAYSLGAIEDGSQFLTSFITIYEGIYVAAVDGAGNFLPLSPGQAQDAEGSWMWRNTRMLSGRTTEVDAQNQAFTFGVVPECSMVHVDIPVKRILTDRQVLIYTVTCVSQLGPLTNNPESVAGIVNLRVLVRSKG